MSHENTVDKEIKEVLKTRRVTPELLKKLLSSATPEERKFVLELETQHRPGPSFDDIEDFKIIIGRADVIQVDHYYNYPTDDRSRYVIIPKTLPVVIWQYHKWDYGTDVGKHSNLLIFTAQGWKKIPIGPVVPDDLELEDEDATEENDEFEE